MVMKSISNLVKSRSGLILKRYFPLGSLKRLPYEKALMGWFGRSSRSNYTRGNWTGSSECIGISISTLSVNVMGTFLLCFIIAGAFRKLAADKQVQDIVTTGFLGSSTTFSALSMKTVLLVEKNQIILAALICLIQYNRRTFCRGTRLSSRQEEGEYMTSFDLLMIGIGGFSGAIIRYVISTSMNRAGDNSPEVPWSLTWLVRSSIGLRFWYGNSTDVDITFCFGSSRSLDDIFYYE